MRARMMVLALALPVAGCTLLAQGTSQEVTFESEPPGASFTVAGQTAVTPVTIDLPKNDYEIVFHREGYQDETVELHRSMSAWFYGSLATGVIGSVIDISTGAWQQFDTTHVKVALVELPGTPKELKVHVASAPGGAEILIGNVLYGRTPRDLTLSWKPQEREKAVTLRLEKHRPITLVLRRGQARLQSSLEPMPVSVPVRVVSTPPGAEIRVEGRVVGTTPRTVDLTWSRNAPPKTIELVLPGYAPVKRSVAAPTRTVSATLKEVVEKIPLQVNVTPKGAQISVDGKAVAVAPAKVVLDWSVSKTRHTITVSRPGYRTRTVTVLRPNAARPLTLKLVPSVGGGPKK